MTDRIVLAGLVFEGHHGWGDEERAMPQPVHVDVTLVLDLAGAASSDDLAQTVDYSGAAKLVGRVIRERSFRLIETIAETIAAELLDANPAVDEIEVRVHKPRIRLGDAGGTATVEIRRRRAADP